RPRCSPSVRPLNAGVPPSGGSAQRIPESPERLIAPTACHGLPAVRVHAAVAHPAPRFIGEAAPLLPRTTHRATARRPSATIVSPFTALAPRGSHEWRGEVTLDSFSSNG